MKSLRRRRGLLMAQYTGSAQTHLLITTHDIISYTLLIAYLIVRLDS